MSDMPPPPLRRNNWLMLYGALTAAVYLLTALFYLKGPKVHSRAAREIFAWFFCIALLFLFWKGYQQIKRVDKPNLRIIVGFAALFCLLAFLVVPFHSTDVFGYINRGWQQVHYGLNPYIRPLAEIPNWQQDPMLTEHWLYNPNPYGFLFTLVARLLAYLGNGNWWLTLALFKTLNVAAYASTGAIIWSATKRLPNVKPANALYLFLWNPLILMHHIANGHNDILTGLMVLLAVYFAITERYLWIVPALVCATLLKFGPIVLIPPALIFVIKNKGWRVAALSCLIGLALFGAISFPYLRDWNELRLADMQGNATLIDNSLHSLLIHIFENIARVFSGLAPFHAIVDTVIKNVLRGGLIIFLLYQWLKIPRNYTAKALATKSLLILFVLICVASSKFNAWYLGMILPLALLMEDDYWLRRLVVLISCTELLSLTFFKQAYMLNYFAMIVIPAWLVYRQERRRKLKVA
jgi:alpha-1,6-mannosyltransferase